MSLLEASNGVKWTQASPATGKRPGLWPNLNERSDMAQSSKVRDSSGRFAPQPFAERFWSHVDRSGGPEACWPYRGGSSPAGYGIFSLGSKLAGGRGAHRVAYELAVGPIPVGLYLCHRCDNPPCCNPTHLFAGTASDNMQDAKAKGRMHPHYAPTASLRYPRGDDHYSRQHPERLARGERHGMAKLSDEQVREIRATYVRGQGATMARRYGIAKRYLSAIVCLQTRRGV